MTNKLALHAATVTELVEWARSGSVSAEQIVRSCLDRIEEREPAVCAWAFIDPDYAIAQARDVDHRSERGLLHGVPVAIKDIIATADMPTQYGSPIYANHRPGWDAACVSAIRSAGGVVLGKTVTTEFASTYAGKTMHPMDPTRTPGGSSSGSAAAVADLMVPLAVGTQTGGSVIRPASFCGIVGYKPSFGLINRHGVKPLSESLDTVGGMGRSIADAARLVSVMANRPEFLDPLEFHRPRLAVWQSEAMQQAEPAMLDCLQATLRQFASCGARIEDVKPSSILEEADGAHHEIEYFEMAQALAFEIQTHPTQLSPALRERLDHGRQCPVTLYVEKKRIAEECRAAIAEIFLRFDAIILPSALGEAPKGHIKTGNALFNRIWTLFYGPAITIPAGRGANGLPLGVQIIGCQNDDRKTLAVARWAERAVRLRY